LVHNKSFPFNGKISSEAIGNNYTHESVSTAGFAMLIFVNMP